MVTSRAASPSFARSALVAASERRASSFALSLARACDVAAPAPAPAAAPAEEEEEEDTKPEDVFFDSDAEAEEEEKEDDDEFVQPTAPAPVAAKTVRRGGAIFSDSDED